MLGAVARFVDMVDGGGARLRATGSDEGHEGGDAALMARPAPDTVPTVLWTLSNAAERQALLDAAPGDPVATQRGAPVGREPVTDAGTSPDTGAQTPSAAPVASEQFLAMLGEVTYPTEQAEELSVGESHKSFSWGGAEDSFTGFGMSPSPTTNSNKLSKGQIAELRAAGIAVKVDAQGNAFLPAVGGYAVPASSGMGTSLGKVLAAQGGSPAPLSGASAGGASTGSGAAAPASADTIIVTARTGASTNSGSLTMAAALQAAGNAAPASAPPPPAAPAPVAAKAGEPEIVVTGTRMSAAEKAAYDRAHGPQAVAFRGGAADGLRVTNPVITETPQPRLEKMPDGTIVYGYYELNAARTHANFVPVSALDEVGAALARAGSESLRLGGEFVDGAIDTLSGLAQLAGDLAISGAYQVSGLDTLIGSGTAAPAPVCAADARNAAVADTIVSGRVVTDTLYGIASGIDAALLHNDLGPAARGAGGLALGIGIGIGIGRAGTFRKPAVEYTLGTERIAVGGVANLPSGSFSISDWLGYPIGVPRPQGPFRIVEGTEYNAVRNAANNANSAIRQQQGLVGQPLDVHEIQPVKFGGSPTDPANKAVLSRDFHRQQVTPWWNQLQRDIGN